MQFRTATIADLDRINHIESISFPVNEAATRESFAKRLAVFPHHFLLLEVDDVLVGFINGMVSQHETIQDVMFEHAELHDNDAGWQSIFGIAVTPEFRKNGYAGKLIQRFIEKAAQEERTGVTLTCKAALVPYYEKFGFADLGISKSVHGGEVWHDMTIRFK